MSTYIYLFIGVLVCVLNNLYLCSPTLRKLKLNKIVYIIQKLKEFQTNANI